MIKCVKWFEVKLFFFLFVVLQFPLKKTCLINKPTNLMYNGPFSFHVNLLLSLNIFNNKTYTFMCVCLDSFFNIKKNR